MVAYVQSMGAVWRINERNFERLKRTIKNSEPFDLDEFGPMVTTNLLNLSDIETEVLRTEGKES